LGREVIYNQERKYITTKLKTAPKRKLILFIEQLSLARHYCKGLFFLSFLSKSQLHIPSEHMYTPGPETPYSLARPPDFFVDKVSLNEAARTVWRVFIEYLWSPHPKPMITTLIQN
jgi:hypothetical protein